MKELLFLMDLIKTYFYDVNALTFFSAQFCFIFLVHYIFIPVQKARQ